MAEPILWFGLTAVPFAGLVARAALDGSMPSPGLHPFLEFRHFAAAGLLVGTAFLWRRIGWVGFRPLVGWGALAAPISYSLYVIHEPTLADAHYLAWIGIPVLEWALYVAITLAFCLFVEVWMYPRLRNVFLRPSVH